jgi:hypothetical protein
MPMTTTEKKHARIHRVERRIVTLYNLGSTGFKAADISRACNLKSPLSAARVIAGIRPEDIGGIVFELPKGTGVYRFISGPDRIIDQGAAHVLKFITDEWQSIPDIAFSSTSAARIVRKHMKTLKESGYVEDMWDGELGVWYWRLKRETTFHRASEEGVKK